MPVSTQAPDANRARLTEAIDLIGSVPGYERECEDLSRWLERGRLRVNMDLPDRALVGLLGSVSLGPETLESSALSIAQTLVHEHYHLRRQHIWQKTLSFWAGVFTASPVMARYEAPAYRAALSFLQAAAEARPHLAAQAEAEAREVQHSFLQTFQAEL